MTVSAQVPEHITPQSLMDMSGDDIETMLDAIRERRLNAVRQYEEAQKVAKEAADAKARTALLKACEMLSNELTRLNKNIMKVEDRVTKVRALRLELGMD